MRAPLVAILVAAILIVGVIFLLSLDSDPTGPPPGPLPFTPGSDPSPFVPDEPGPDAIPTNQPDPGTAITDPVPAPVEPTPDATPPGTGTGISISGTVVGFEGAPVPGAHLRWIPGSRGRNDVRSARTDDDGAYSIEDVPSRTGTLFVTHPDHVTVKVANVSPGQASGVIQMSAGAMIRGLVRRNGEPVPGIVVRLRGPGVAKQATSGRDGRFAFGALEEGTHLIRIEAPTSGDGNGELLADPLEVVLQRETDRDVVIDLD